MGILRNRLQILMAEYNIRNKTRLTMEQLAKETGITQATISRIYHGEVGISGSTIEKLCNFFHCQPGDLLFMEYETEPQ